MIPMARKSKQQRFSALKSGKQGMVLSGVFVTFIFLLLFLYPPTLFSSLEQNVYDVMHGRIPPPNRHVTAKGKDDPSQSGGEAWKGHQPTPLPPVIIDIDEKSLKVVGQWPWPRYRIATLFEMITDNHPVAVGVDILFPETDRTSLKAVMETLEARSGIRVPLKGVPEGFHDNDMRMAQALRSGPVMLACKFLSDGPFEEALPNHPELLPFPLDVVRRYGSLSISEKGDVGAMSDNLPNETSWPQWKRVLMPLPLFVEAVAYRCGFINTMPDSDGTIRRTPILTRFGSRFFPSLALMTVMQQMKKDKVILQYGMFGLEAVQIGKRVISVSPDGKMMILYRNSARPFECISASDLLANPVDARLKDRIVFVGTSAAGLGDRHVTPMERVYPGIYIHASIVENIINESFISRPVWTRGAEFVCTLCAGLISMVLLIYAPPIICLLFSLIMGLLLWSVPLLLLQKEHLYISMLFPFLLFFCNVALLSVIRFRIGEKAVWQKTLQMSTAQDLTLKSISGLASRRDGETRKHVNRTAHYVLLLARQLAHHPDYRHVLDEMTIDMIYKSAPLHDIGKVAVPDRILAKTGEMTEDEFREIKRHTEYGWETICRAEEDSKIDGSTSFLMIAKDLIRYHHEKWDGTGYNHGLKGTEIPLAARLMALADVYDGLITTQVTVAGRITDDHHVESSWDQIHGEKEVPHGALEMKRHQKNEQITRAHERAIKIIGENRGTHFDPEVVDAFLAQEKHFKSIALKMTDDPY